MQLYPVSSPAASTIAEGAGGTTIVAIVAGGLVSPTGRPLGLHEVSALAVGGTAKIRTGDTVTMDALWLLTGTSRARRGSPG